MINPGLGLAAAGIERILELSADAQIKRREVAKGSPAFHSLTGAIAAYGRVLALIAALEQPEEFLASLTVHSPAEYAAPA